MTILHIIQHFMLRKYSSLWMAVVCFHTIRCKSLHAYPHCRPGTLNIFRAKTRGCIRQRTLLHINIWTHPNLVPCHIALCRVQFPRWGLSFRKGGKDWTTHISKCEKKTDKSRYHLSNTEVDGMLTLLLMVDLRLCEAWLYITDVIMACMACYMFLDSMVSKYIQFSTSSQYNK